MTMVLRATFLLGSLAIATAAFAQQGPPQAIDRIAGSLAQCISTAEQKVDQINVLQQQLAVAQRRIAELELKKEEPAK
jgi:TolA-binding protein